MRHLFILAAAAAISTNIARAEERPECKAIPLPPEKDRAPYALGGPYARGMRLLAQGKNRQAMEALESAWAGVRRELGQAFAADTCKLAKVRAAQMRHLRASPPTAVPAEDRFLPPLPVMWTAARAACEVSDLKRAASWLLPAALAQDPEATAAAAVTLLFAGHQAEALALIPANAQNLALRAARALIQRRMGQEATAIEVPEGSSLCPVAAGIMSLLRGDGD